MGGDLLAQGLEGAKIQTQIRPANASTFDEDADQKAINGTTKNR